MGYGDPHHDSPECRIPLAAPGDQAPTQSNTEAPASTKQEEP
jgi:hypothetical protein